MRQINVVPVQQIIYIRLQLELAPLSGRRSIALNNQYPGTCFIATLVTTNPGPFGLGA